MIFMSNLLVDSRPCGSQAPVVAYQLIEEPGGPLPLASVGNPGPGEVLFCHSAVN